MKTHALIGMHPAFVPILAEDFLLRGRCATADIEDGILRGVPMAAGK